MPEITKQKTSRQDSEPADCPYPDCPYKRKVAILEYELKEMRERYWSRKKKKLDEESLELVSARKRGAPTGHPGWFRKIGARIDEFVDVTLTRCPKCGGKKLTCCQNVEEHVQEDIVLPQLKVTCFRHYSYWCEDCKEIVEPERPAGELPKSYIGPTAKALAVWLKYDIKISDRDLKRLFETLFNLRIVPASVAGFRNQLARYGIFIYQKIQEALQNSSYIHSDETGWRVGSENRWLWSLSNKSLSFFHIDPSRGLKVLRSLLKEPFHGTLVADFLSVYNRYKAGRIQRCLVHLRREIRKILKVWGDDPGIRRYLERLKDWIDRAASLGKKSRLGHIKKARLKNLKAALERELSDFNHTTCQKKPLIRIQKRLERHRQELLTFLDYPEVDSNNNHAERQIRPNVLLRKITFGNDSDRGAQNHGIFMSIIQTAKQNGRSPPDILRKIISTRGKGRSLESLGIGRRSRCRRAQRVTSLC